MRAWDLLLLNPVMTENQTIDTLTGTQRERWGGGGGGDTMHIKASSFYKQIQLQGMVLTHFLQPILCKRM